MTAPVQRIGAPTVTRWMIYGSYVLDVVFEVTLARDLDVGFDPQFRRPTESEIRQRLAGLSLPVPPATIQMTRCHDFSIPEAGGYPCFNIDFWQIHMDGNVYVAEPNTHSHHVLTATEPHTLEIVDAKHLTATRAVDGLEKMHRYPALHTNEVATVLQGTP